MTLSENFHDEIFTSLGSNFYFLSFSNVLTASIDDIRVCSASLAQAVCFGCHCLLPLHIVIKHEITKQFVTIPCLALSEVNENALTARKLSIGRKKFLI